MKSPHSIALAAMLILAVTAAAFTPAKAWTPVYTANLSMSWSFVTLFHSLITGRPINGGGRSSTAPNCGGCTTHDPYFDNPNRH